MKLATYKDGSRDGQLVVVSRDLNTAHYANGCLLYPSDAADEGLGVGVGGGGVR